MNALLWASYCMFLAGMFLALGCWLVVYTEKMARKQGREEARPLRLKNGQLIGRALK